MLPTSINLIGSGRMAWQLGTQMQKVGLDIKAVFSPTFSHAHELARCLKADCPSTLFKLPQAELCIIAVADSAIEKVASGLPANQHLVVHTSGSQPLALLEAHCKRAGVFYPMQSFSRTSTPNWARIPIFLETTQQDDLPRLKNLARTLGCDAYELASEKRGHLHLAAVFASNFTNHMLHLACQSAKPLGSEEIPFEVFEGLVEETVRKAFALGPDKAQTGPAARGDQAVIDRHLQALDHAPRVQELYRLISASIQDHAREWAK